MFIYSLSIIRNQTMPPIRTDKLTSRSRPYESARSSSRYEPLRTPHEFLYMIKEYHKANPAKLSQDETAPRACKNCGNTAIKTTSVHNRLGNQVDERTPLLFWRHQASQLSELMTHGSNSNREHLTDAQLKAIDAFNAMIEDHSEHAVLQRLGHPDARSVNGWEMERLIILLTTIFFQTTPWDRMEVRFDWSNQPSDPGSMGDCTCAGPDQPYAVVRLSASEVRPFRAFRHLTGRAMSRLSTLLHELVHAYVGYYACPCCSSSREDLVQLGGHGRVWQRIARSVERFANDTLGLPIDLCRFEAVFNNWDDMLFWPTEDEVEGWELVW